MTPIGYGTAASWYGGGLYVLHVTVTAIYDRGGTSICILSSSPVNEEVIVIAYANASMLISTITMISMAWAM